MKARCPMCWMFGKRIGMEHKTPGKKLYPGYVECGRCGFQWKKADWVESPKSVRTGRLLEVGEE